MQKLVCSILLSILALTSLGQSPAVAVDTRIAPILVSAELNAAGSEVLLTYDIPLDSSQLPLMNQLKLEVDGTIRTFSKVEVTGDTTTQVKLTLGRLILSGQNVSFTYSAPDPIDDTLANNAIQSTSGIDAASLNAQVITNSSVIKESVINPFGGKFAALHRLSGFADRYSVLPGEKLKLLVRSVANFKVKIIRISSRSKGTGVAVPLPATSGVYNKISQKSCTTKKSTGTVNCAWKPSLVVPTVDLTSGLYVARLESNSHFHIIPFVVKSNPSEPTTAFVMSWMSLMAYNRFGGYSAYELNSSHKSASAISANRPLDLFGLRIFKQFEVAPAIAVDRNVPNATYTTDIDLDMSGVDMSRISSMVTSGHAEYWSMNLRKRVESRVNSGMNLFVVGANSIYRKVAVDNSANYKGRRLLVLKNTKKKVQNSTDRNFRFRDWPKSWPETKLLGVGYQYFYHRCGAKPNAWKIADRNWWGYQGTNVRNSQQIPALVGTEVDQVLEGYAIPDSTQIVAHGRYQCNASGRNLTANHDATYITTNKGGAVFATGTQKWACAMNGTCMDRGFTSTSNRFAKTVTDNVIRAFNQGPAGKQAGHAARFNVGKFYKKTYYKKFDR